MSIPAAVRAVIEPVVAAQGVELFDLEQAGPVLRVTIDRPGGVDIDVIASVTRALSRALDEHDPISGQYTLEVSSPGLERALRTPAHWQWAVGRQVSIKTIPDHPRGRRFTGVVTAATATTASIAVDEPAGEVITFPLGEIDKARTVFVWDAKPKPGGKGAKPTKAARPTSSTTIDPDPSGSVEEKVQS